MNPEETACSRCSRLRLTRAPRNSESVVKTCTNSRQTRISAGRKGHRQTLPPLAKKLFVIIAAGREKSQFSSAEWLGAGTSGTLH